MSKDAVIVIDMLNDFADPKGALYCPNGRTIIPNIQDLLKFSHERGIQVVFIQEAHRKNDKDFLVRPVHAVKGTWGSDFIDELRPEEDKGDYIIQKRRHSSFAYTDLDLFLREEGIDTVVLTGTWTNVCVRSTGSDALYHTYKVVCISDCVASKTEEMHQAGLVDISLFGKVMTLAEYKASKN
ncbi:MAG: cysteine hydrolase [Deltaproteobacteria bacterium]|jgi:nicotinamidase-related amidase|nr:cysteine hydrolase [Deltaproteobacteria bacterium]MDR1296736.1 cysteine hydrolase [Deltaproteobacteria bacterium]